MRTRSDLLFFAALTFSGAAWVPLADGVELSNAMAVAVILAGALSMRGRLKLPAEVVLLLAALAWLFFSLALKNGGGEAHALRSGAYVLMCLALYQLRPPAFGRIVGPATGAYLGLIFLSSLLAGQNLLLGIAEYLVSLDRSRFVFQVIRPTLNGLASGDAVYVASVMNALASGLAILFVVAAAHRAWVAAAVTGLLTFILFSASAVLAVTATLALLGARWVIRSRRKIGPAVALAMAALATPWVLDQAAAYVLLNIVEDGASRSARLQQYALALELIDGHVLWGMGYARVGGHNIHNALLFSWVAGGIVPALILLCVYGLVLRSLLRAAVRAVVGDLRWLAVFGLLSVFLIRITFGGGGGLPEATAMTALAIALVLERQLSAEEGEAPTRLGPDPPPVRRRLRRWPKPL